MKFKAPLNLQGTVRVEVGWKPCTDPSKGRRVDVKFERCEFNVAGLPKLDIPLGPIGPPGCAHARFGVPVCTCACMCFTRFTELPCLPVCGLVRLSCLSCMCVCVCVCVCARAHATAGCTTELLATALFPSLQKVCVMRFFLLFFLICV